MCQLRALESDCAISSASTLSALGNFDSLAIQNAHSECSNVQADLNPHRIYTSELTFSRVPANIFVGLPASVTQLDARPIRDQEVVGSNPTGTFFCGDMTMTYFRRLFSSIR